MCRCARCTASKWCNTQVPGDSSPGTCCSQRTRSPKVGTVPVKHQALSPFCCNIPGRQASRLLTCRVAAGAPKVTYTSTVKTHRKDKEAIPVCHHLTPWALANKKVSPDAFWTRIMSQNNLFTKKERKEVGKQRNRRTQPTTCASSMGKGKTSREPGKQIPAQLPNRAARHLRRQTLVFLATLASLTLF